MQRKTRNDLELLPPALAILCFVSVFPVFSQLPNPSVCPEHPRTPLSPTTTTAAQGLLCLPRALCCSPGAQDMSLDGVASASLGVSVQPQDKAVLGGGCPIGLAGTQLLSGDCPKTQ